MCKDFWHISKLLFNDVSRSCGKNFLIRQQCCWDMVTASTFVELVRKYCYFVVGLEIMNVFVQMLGMPFSWSYDIKRSSWWVDVFICQPHRCHQRKITHLVKVCVCVCAKEQYEYLQRRYYILWIHNFSWGCMSLSLSHHPISFQPLDETL